MKHRSYINRYPKKKYYTFSLCLNYPPNFEKILIRGCEGVPRTEVVPAPTNGVTVLKSRPFYRGFTPWPYDLDADEFLKTWRYRLLRWKGESQVSTTGADAWLKLPRKKVFHHF